MTDIIWYRNCLFKLRYVYGLQTMIKKILIVDDHVSFLAGLSKALKKFCDYTGEITTVGSGEKAIDEVSSSFYDICFLDLNLPDIYGLDVMEKIHYISPKTRVVIMTAESIDEDKKRKIKEGASLFLAKPVELDEVMNFINGEPGQSEDSDVDGKNNGREHMGEKRQYTRKPYNKTVRCSISVFYNWELKSDLKADMIDISYEGAGIKARYPLYPGNILRFDNVLENKSGIVKWSIKSGDDYRAGIKFL